MVLPGPLGHLVGDAPGSLSSHSGWTNNSAVIGPDEAHVLSTGRVPDGRVFQISFASHTDQLSDLEEGQHPGMLMHQDTLMRAPGAPFRNYAAPEVSQSVQAEWRRAYSYQ